MNKISFAIYEYSMEYILPGFKLISNFFFLFVYDKRERKYRFLFWQCGGKREEYYYSSEGETIFFAVLPIYSGFEGL